MKINSKNDLINNYYLILVLNNFLKTKSRLIMLNWTAELRLQDVYTNGFGNSEIYMEFN